MGKRRNVTRLSLLTLVARPWFDPVADLAGGQGRGVIPALELEEDAITVSYRCCGSLGMFVSVQSRSFFRGEASC